MSTHSLYSCSLYALQRDCRAFSEYQNGNIQYKTYDSKMKMDDYLPHLSISAAPWTPPVMQTDHALCITPDKPRPECQNFLGISTKNTIISSSIQEPSLCLTTKQSVNTLSGIPLNSGDMIPTRQTLLKTDPLLTVTPEKSVPTMSEEKSSSRSVKKDGKVKQKLKCKVRFDIDNNVTADVNMDSEQTKSVGNKVYEPRLYGGMDESDIFYRSDDLPRKIVSAVFPSVKSRWSDQDLDLSMKGSAYDMSFETSTAKIKSDINPACESKKRGDGPVLTISDHNNSHNKYKVVVTREIQERPVVTEYEYPFESTKTSDTEHVFSRPEFHNSLKVCRALKDTGNLVLNVVTALNRHLRDSEETVTEISEKASAKVNQRFSTNMYCGLVGLEPPIGDMCLQTEKQITLRARPTKYQSRKQADDYGPDLMEFFNCEFEKESPDLLFIDGNYQSEDIKIAPQCLAYDLYRHNQVWQATQ